MTTETVDRGEGMPIRAYSYARVSGKGKQCRGDGLRRQQGRLTKDDESYPEKISRENGWVLDDTLVFTDAGRSAFHGKNRTPTADLTRFLDLCRSGRIARGSVLIVENLDRLSREEVDIAYDLFRDILRLGITICTRIPERIYRAESKRSFMDCMDSLWQMHCAHLESKKKSERSAENWERARSQLREAGRKLPGKVPAWIVRTKAGFSVAEDRAGIIRTLFQLSLNGQGVETIARRLNAEQVTPIGYREKWVPVYVLKTLKSRAVLGEFQPKRGGKNVGEPIPNYYPAILDVETFNRVQVQLAVRKQRRGRRAKHGVNLLLGLSWDAETGQRLVKRSFFKRGHLYNYMTIPGEAHGYCDYSAVEEAVLATLDKLRTQDVIEPAKNVAGVEKLVADLTTQSVALDNRRRQLGAMLEDPDEDSAEILEAIRGVKSKLKAITAQLETVKLESYTGRGEALAAAQELVRYRREVPEDQREELDYRIRGALPSVLDSVWCLRQRLSARRKIVHVQVWLKNGQSRYAQLLPDKLRPGDHVEQLRDTDFRTLALETAAK